MCVCYMYMFMYCLNRPLKAIKDALSQSEWTWSCCPCCAAQDLSSPPVASEQFAEHVQSG